MPSTREWRDEHIANLRWPRDDRK